MLRGAALFGISRALQACSQAHIKATDTLRMPKNAPVLNSELTTLPLKPVQIKLIPYYAWKNRGITDMSVWLPISW